MHPAPAMQRVEVQQRPYIALFSQTGLPDKKRRKGLFPHHFVQRTITNTIAAAAPAGNRFLKKMPMKAVVVPQLFDRIEKLLALCVFVTHSRIIIT